LFGEGELSGYGVDMAMQDYKSSLCAAVIICAILVIAQTDRQLSNIVLYCIVLYLISALFNICGNIG